MSQADRARRARDRQRRGVRCYHVEVGPGVFSELIDAGVLPATSIDDHAAIEAALALALEAWAAQNFSSRVTLACRGRR